MTQPPHGQGPGAPAPWGAAGPMVCSWHPDRPTGLQCSRCGRPACPECLRPASVGQHCRACVAEAQQQHRAPLTVSGARLGVPPLVATVLIAVNVVVYVITAVNAGSFDQPQLGELFFDGAMLPANVADGQWWRVITSGFLHYGLIHLAANMLSLYFLGPTLEQVLGRVRFLVVYLVSLLGGSAAVMLFAGQIDQAAGASGAIFGLMGALVVTFRRLRLNLGQLAGVLVVNLLITFTLPGISWQAHLGGLVAGAAIGAAMVYPPARIRRTVQVVASIGITAVLAALIVVKAGTIEVPPRCIIDAATDQAATYYCQT